MSASRTRTLAGAALGENDLLDGVIHLAKLAGFRVAHFRPAKTARGRWITAMSGDVGWPDLILCGHGRFLVAELKAARGSLTTDQARWRFLLEEAGVEYHLWKPEDWVSGRIATALGVTDGIIHPQKGQRCQKSR